MGKASSSNHRPGIIVKKHLRSPRGGRSGEYLSICLKIQTGTTSRKV